MRAATSSVSLGQLEKPYSRASARCALASVSSSDTRWMRAMAERAAIRRGMNFGG